MQSVLGSLRWILRTADARDLSPVSVFLCGVGLAVFVFYIQIFYVIFAEPGISPLFVMVIAVAAFAMAREVYRMTATVLAAPPTMCDILAASVTVPFATVLPPWFVVFLIHFSWKGLKEQAYWLYLSFAHGPSKLILAFLESPGGVASAAFLAIGVLGSTCATRRARALPGLRE